MNAEFKINGKIIETERLVLRPFKDSDLDDLYEYASVPGVGERAGWKHHESREESRRILDMFIESDNVFAITLKGDGRATSPQGLKSGKATASLGNESGKVIGSLGNESGKVIGSLGVEKYGMEAELTEFDAYRGRELGFVLGKDYWGQGLVPEAVKAVTCFLFSQWDLDFIICGYYDFNAQSSRVQEKCGFKPYRKLSLKTTMGTTEEGQLNLLLNPGKKMELQFSHPETLIWKD